MTSIPLIQTLLFAWYSKRKRTFLWRELQLPPVVGQIRDPYTVLVSELMLQQTQASRVVPLYQAFLERWPTLLDFSSAKLSEVIIAWKGLGYNRRAKHLLETARIITTQYDGIFPQDISTLQTFPGIGPYTSAALMVFAFGKACVVIDVNIKRIFSRLLWGLKSAPTSKELSEIVEQFIPSADLDTWYQALMDFGALVCTAKDPKCGVCPLLHVCTANREAKHEGFDSFAAWLKEYPRVKRESIKDRGKKFIETDRFFRGRIIDFLRLGTVSVENVWQEVSVHYHLGDRVRFARIIEQLVIDGLIRIQGNRVALA